jgi:hypothetical protein
MQGRCHCTEFVAGITLLAWQLLLMMGNLITLALAATVWNHQTAAGNGGNATAASCEDLGVARWLRRGLCATRGPSMQV